MLNGGDDGNYKEFQDDEPLGDSDRWQDYHKPNSPESAHIVGGAAAKRGIPTDVSRWLKNGYNPVQNGN